MAAAFTGRIVAHANGRILSCLYRGRGVCHCTRFAPSGLGKGWMDGSVQVFVTAPEEVMQVIKVGDQTRTVGATKMNERSSRSHSLLMVAPTRIFMASWPADVPCRGYL